VSDETVGEVATLYLGNVLYAIERCALSLDAEDKPLDAAFYRGIGRKLAEAHGRHRSGPSSPGPSDYSNG
jgi:hypothetical protein